MYHTDTYVSLSISVPKSLRNEIHERALRLRMTRTDYVKALILKDLAGGLDAPLTMEYKTRPLEAGTVLGGEGRKTRGGGGGAEKALSLR
jgi:hypothetical protein